MRSIGSGNGVMEMSRYSEAQKQAQARYDKVNVRRIVLKLVRNTDGDLIEWLESKDNIQGYIKNLIRNDMKEE